MKYLVDANVLCKPTILGDDPTVSFVTAREYLELFGEDTGGRIYKLLADRRRRLSGLVVALGTSACRRSLAELRPCSVDAGRS